MTTLIKTVSRFLYLTTHLLQTLLQSFSLMPITYIPLKTQLGELYQEENLIGF